MGEPTLMQLQPTERFRTFDVGSFVSYQTDEDVTPTEAELVEDIPQHLMPVGPSEEEIAAKAAKPRRGKAYLRTEIDESPKPDAKADAKSDAKSDAKADDGQSEGDDFGAGIDDETSPTDSAKPAVAKRSSHQGSESNPSNPAAESDAPGRKRKRRRRKRSGGRRESDSAGSNSPNASDSDVPTSTTGESVSAVAVNTDGPNQPSPGDAESSSETPRTGKKRRRRRRRRGANSGANSDSGNTSTPDQSANDPGST